MTPFSTVASSNCTGYKYVEDSNSVLEYFGDWTLDNNSVYGGTYSHGGSHSYTASGSVEFTFSGTEYSSMVKLVQGQVLQIYT